jgi:hypothetical protein
MEYEYCYPNGTQNKKYENSQTVKNTLKSFILEELLQNLIHL